MICNGCLICSWLRTSTTMMIPRCKRPSMMFKLICWEPTVSSAMMTGSWAMSCQRMRPPRGLLHGAHVMNRHFSNCWTRIHTSPNPSSSCHLRQCRPNASGDGLMANMCGSGWRGFACTLRRQVVRHRNEEPSRGKGNSLRQSLRNGFRHMLLGALVSEEHHAVSSVMLCAAVGLAS